MKNFGISLWNMSSPWERLQRVKKKYRGRENDSFNSWVQYRRLTGKMKTSIDLVFETPSVQGLIKVLYYLRLFSGASKACCCLIYTPLYTNLYWWWNKPDYYQTRLYHFYIHSCHKYSGSFWNTRSFLPS